MNKRLKCKIVKFNRLNRLMKEIVKIQRFFSGKIFWKEIYEVFQKSLWLMNRNRQFLNMVEKIKCNLPKDSPVNILKIAINAILILF